jgi:hypothetical protein
VKGINAAKIHSTVWQHFDHVLRSEISPFHACRIRLTFWTKLSSKVVLSVSSCEKSTKFHESYSVDLGRQVRSSLQASCCLAVVLSVSRSRALVALARFGLGSLDASD